MNTEHSKERWHWYSDLQAMAMAENSRTKTIPVALLDDGTEAIFTESTDVGSSPSGTWDDYVFIGKGKYIRQTRNQY